MTTVEAMAGGLLPIKWTIGCEFMRRNRRRAISRDAGRVLGEGSPSLRGSIDTADPFPRPGARTAGWSGRAFRRRAQQTRTALAAFQSTAGNHRSLAGSARLARLRGFKARSGPDGRSYFDERTIGHACSHSVPHPPHEWRRHRCRAACYR